jgi:hypothetical protein
LYSELTYVTRPTENKQPACLQSNLIPAVLGKGILHHFRITGILVVFLSLSLPAAGQTTDFSASATEICIGRSVIFSDNSSGGNIESYSWDFGEGAVPAIANGVGPHMVTYMTAGHKTVSLELQRTGPSFTSETKIDYILVNAEISLGYGFQRIISINHQYVEGDRDLIDFPLLVKIDADPGLRSVLAGGRIHNENGWDLVFTDDNFNILDHEIQEYDALSGKMIAWVRIPLLHHDINTSLRVLYGNPAITVNPSTSRTWNSNYAAVWHLSDDNELIRDATFNQNNGNNQGSTSIPSKIGSGRNFNQPDGQFISIPWDESLELRNNQVTIQAWVKVAPGSAPDDAPFLAKGQQMNQERYMLGIQNGTNKINSRVTTTNGHFRNDTGVSINSAEEWIHVTMVYDGALDTNPRKLVYKNGELVDAQDAGGLITGDPADLIHIGRRVQASDNRFFHGALDEIRVLKTARSPEWIKTEYLNQNGDVAFYEIYEEIESEFLPSVSLCDASFILNFGFPEGGQYSGNFVDDIEGIYYFNPVESGYAAITYTVPCGDGEWQIITKTITVTGYPDPPLTGDKEFCVSNIGNLHASGRNIKWYGDAGLTDLLHSGSPFLTGAGTGSHTYYVTQSLNGCESSPAPATITVITPVPVITMHPSNVEVCAGENASFSVSANGSSYQWQRNGFDLADDAKINGSQTATLFISGTDLYDAGEYRCIISEFCGEEKFSVTSNPAVLTINAPPVITFGYAWEMDITVDFEKIAGSSDLIDFPLLVSITDPGLRHFSFGGKVSHDKGFDIIFTGNDYSSLFHEIEHYDPETGEFIAWVRIPVLSVSLATEFKMLYGNPAITVNPSDPDTWTDHYVGVWHMNKNNFRNSTGTGHDGRAFGVNTGAAMIGEGGVFQHANSQEDRVELGSIDVPGEKMTISAWINAGSFATHDARIISKASFTDETDHWWMLSTLNGTDLRFRLKTDDNLTTTITAPGVLSTGTDHFLSAVYDGNRMTLFLDGVPVRSEEKTGFIDQNNSVYAAIGNQPESAWPEFGKRAFNGTIDEVRIIKDARSAEWLITEYRNQSDPGYFIEPGDEKPNIWHKFDVCPAETIVYETAETPGSTFLWEATRGTITGGAETSSAMIQWDNSGEGDPSVKLTVISDGCASVIEYPVNFHPGVHPVISGFVMMCQNAEGIIYEVDDIDGHNYEWEIEGGIIAEGQNTSRITVNWQEANENASVSVIQTSENGCSGSAILNVEIFIHPEAQTIVKHPAEELVCPGSVVFASFEGGAGGVDPEDVHEYSVNAGFNWYEYISPQTITSLSPGISQLQIRTRRISDGPGCIESEWSYASWTVAENPAPPVAGNVSIIYDGTAHSAGATVPGGHSIIWFDSPEGGSEISAPGATEAGVYSAWAEAVSPDGCHSTSRTEVTLTIEKKDLTITATDQGKTYGDIFTFDLTFPSDHFTVSGLVNGDAVSEISLTSDGSAAGATVAGSPYAILAGGATGTGLDNYNILYADGQMTVGLRELTITATDQGKTYGDIFTFDLTFPSDHFTVSGLVNGDAVSAISLTSDGAAAGGHRGRITLCNPCGRCNRNRAG